MKDLIISSLLAALFLETGLCTKCYQCSSTEDAKPPQGIWAKDRFTQDRFEDNCGVYWPFETERNIPVECNSDESVSPGTFCLKEVQQGPIGFMWDGRWRQVNRRCASVAGETGVTGICNWGVKENGVFWEECYCSDDACNSAILNSPNIAFSCLIAAIWILLT